MRRRENFYLYMARIGNLSDPFDFRRRKGRKGEREGRDTRFRTMANFWKVHDFADRTIHEYTGWVQAITLITLNPLPALFSHGRNFAYESRAA